MDSLREAFGAFRASWKQAVLGTMLAVAALILVGSICNGLPALLKFGPLLSAAGALFGSILYAYLSAGYFLFCFGLLENRAQYALLFRGGRCVFPLLVIQFASGLLSLALYGPFLLIYASWLPRSGIGPFVLLLGLLVVLYTQFRLSLAIPAAVEGGTGATAAMLRSWRLTAIRPLRTVGVFALASLALCLGLLMCGLGFFAGLPLATLIYLSMYRRLTPAP